MEVRHCPNRHCKDGKVIDYGSPHDPVIDCEECGGTGHVIITEIKVPAFEPVALLNVNPMVGLHDKDSCDGYLGGVCEEDPCPDCELAYDTQENE